MCSSGVSLSPAVSQIALWLGGVVFSAQLSSPKESMFAGSFIASVKGLKFSKYSHVVTPGGFSSWLGVGEISLASRLCCSFCFFRGG